VIPQVIGGKYALVREIGRGGMGSVWEARHTTLGTRVAIKFLGADLLTNKDARKRFEVEARAMATVQSKYAVQIFDHGVTSDGLPFIVMELLEGESLEARLATRGRLSLGETTTIMLQVCLGLSRAHEHGIVHRDLKPENIFLVRSSDEKGEVAKVVDFGIAKLRESLDTTKVTKTGTIVGTPWYMAPEQVRGARSLDYHADLWSLAVIVFQCLTGRLPFDAPSLGALVVQVCSAPIPAPSTIVPDLPVSLDAWMRCALDRDPSRRFQSASELSQTLRILASQAGAWGHAAHDSFHDELTVASRPPSGSPQTTGAVSLRPPSGGRHVALAIAAVWVLILASLAFVLQAKRARRASADAAVSLGAALGPVQHLRVCGSSTGSHLMRALVEAYFRRLGASDVHIEPREKSLAVVASKGSEEVDIETEDRASAFGRLGAGGCDVVVSSRRIDAREAEDLRSRGLGDLRAAQSEHVIALDGAAVIVHPTNPVAAIGVEMLSRVLSGEVTSWQALGGRAGSIHVLGDRSLSSDAPSFDDRKTVVSALMADEGALGAVGLDTVSTAKALAVTEGSGPALFPTPFNVASGDYPLAHPIFLYGVRGRPLLDALLGFTLGEEGQTVVRASGFVDLRVVVGDLGGCSSQCPPAYASLIARAQRVSVTLYPSIDGEGYRAYKIDALVSWVHSHPAARVALAGFASAPDGHAAAVQRSRVLVSDVAAALEARGIHADRPESFGDAMRPRNDRVEVWVGLR
jgi:eukaryotic-like serine/threonine-protein kinase